MKTIIFIFFVYLSYASAVASGKPTILISPNSIEIQRVRLLSPNMGSWFQNTGIFNQYNRTNNIPGLEWPYKSGKFAVFSSGLSISAFISNSLAQVTASFSGEYTPGYIMNDSGITNSDFKVYLVRFNDNASTNPDYANWYKMVPYGAPYNDVNNNGVFDINLDIPGKPNAYQTTFIAMTDAFVDQRNAGEGFGGGVRDPLLLADIRWTSWTYTHPGLADAQFIEWKIINQSTDTDRVWKRTRVALFTLPEIGDFSDEYIGCDTNLKLGYGYNGKPNDGSGFANSYGQYPPAYGFKVLKGMVDKITNIDQSFTSFSTFMDVSGSYPPCESEPIGEPLGTYNLMSGVKKDLTPWINPLTGAPTKFIYPGDPETGTGWTEFKGSVQNCNGELTGNITNVNPPGTRYLLIGFGKDDFTISPGDTQLLVGVQMVRVGTNHLNSVTMLKRYSEAMQKFYDNEFNSFYSTPSPQVKSSITHLPGDKCEINLLWDDIAESFRYHDTLFFAGSDSNIYEFEGYEIYEVNTNALILPDFNAPFTINPNIIKLIAIYDKRNKTGFIYDTLLIGNYNEFSKVPVIPAFGFNQPENFPNFGLNRSQTIAQTMFPENYGNVSELQYNKKYTYLVMGYSVSRNPDIRRGFRVNRSILKNSLITVIPRRPGNSTFSFVNGDTLVTNRRDLGVVPVVLGQEYLRDAIYRVIYDTPDTTYSIHRSTNNGGSFSVLKSGLKFTLNSSAQDSSRIIDGILIDVEKIVNHGVIRDPGPNSQSRDYGWSYQPENNRFVEGASAFRVRDYQSESMSLVYPSIGYYTLVHSGLPWEELEIVKIVFDEDNGQLAYRYLDEEISGDKFYIYQDMTNVPFRVYGTTDLTGLNGYRQLNCAFVESNDINPATGQWNPTSDSLGGKLLLYVFKSSYSPIPDTAYTTKNLFISVNIDIQYVWAPRLIQPGLLPQKGDSLKIYPYQVTREGTSYEFKTTAPYLDFDTITPPIPPEVPLSYSLGQNFPNPFNPTTRIKFSVPEPTNISLKIYNVLGQLVYTLINNVNYQPGEVTVEFSGNDLSSGIYFYMLEAKNFVKTKKMVLIR